MTRTPYRAAGPLAAVLAAALLALAPATAGAENASDSRAAATSRAYFNNPEHTQANGGARNVTRDLLIDRFRAASPGSKVRMMTYNITDTAITDAMIEAMRDNVTVQVIMARANCKSAAARELRDEAHEHAGTFVKCHADATRSRGGNIHAKYLTFSKVGSHRHRTIVGSANATVEGYADQWVDMYEYVGRKDIFTAYNKVFDVSKKLDPGSPNFFAFSFNGGKSGAQFLPVDDETPTAADDPVLTRIKTLPANADVQIATYAMNGHRGGWLATALINRKQDGMKIRLLTGPPTSDRIEARLREAGIPVVRAFDPDCAAPEDDVGDASCNYIHLKLMTAKYTRNGATQHRVWTGSDNWSDVGLHNDEVAHKIGGKAAWSQYTGFLRQVRERYS